jgi:hypothetical protein
VLAPQRGLLHPRGIGSLKDKLGAADDFAFARRLIEVAGVATVPGSSFYSGGAKAPTRCASASARNGKRSAPVAANLRKLPPDVAKTSEDLARIEV